jgi:hypothetical protein
VDLRKLAPARAPDPNKAAKPVKPAAPAQPSRIWVQVATGRDKQALAFDWRRLVRDEAAVFRGKAPYLAGWGQTNRLLTGPFESEAAANAFVAQLRRADVDGAFLWTSPAGQVVDALPGVKASEASRGEPEPAVARRSRTRAAAEPAAKRKPEATAEPSSRRRSTARAEREATVRPARDSREDKASAMRGSRSAPAEPPTPSRRSKSRR